MGNIYFFLVLITLGYVFGRIAEKRHFKSIHKREQELLPLPATSVKKPLLNVDETVKKSHLVSGDVVVSVDYFKRVLSLLRNVFGGNVRSYETLLDRGRREAILRMKESCPKADQIINLRIETSSISKGRDNKIGCVEVFAYGTAIYLRKTP